MASDPPSGSVPQVNPSTGVGDPSTPNDPEVHQAAEDVASRVLWPWVAKRTPTQIIALVLISCLALGPVAALVTIIRADPTPVGDLAADRPTGPEVTRVTVTATGLSPTTGDFRARISVAAATELADRSGRLIDPVSVMVNGAATAFPAGATVSSFEVGLALAEGSTTRYPFDRYKGVVVVAITVDGRKGPVQELIAMDVRSGITDFVLSAEPGEGMKPEPQPAKLVEWSAKRPATTTVYAIWLMVLMWGLAVTGLLIVWTVVIWEISIPFWVFGYFVGVLFALPPLRDSLPGRPPPGTIFDFGSFYWSVTIIGVSLILILSVWLRRARAQQRLKRLDNTRPG